MATIKLINKRYKVQIRKKGYPSVSRRFFTLADARKFGREIESQMERGVFEDYTSANRTSLKEILIKYRDEKTVLKKGHKEEASRKILNDTKKTNYICPVDWQVIRTGMTQKDDEQSKWERIMNIINTGTQVKSTGVYTQGQTPIVTPGNKSALRVLLGLIRGP